MQRLKVFLCLWVLLHVLAGYGFLSMPSARAQGVPPGITHVTTAQNWSQSSTTVLTGCRTGIRCAIQTLTLSPCPAGLDVSGQGMYDVYISDGSNSESVLVTGGSAKSCPSSATITFVPFFSHSSYKVESASSGIQETINAACGTSTVASQNAQCNVTVPANGGPTGPKNSHPLNTYDVYGTIFFHANQSVLSGYGASLSCLGRGPCLQVGDLVNSGNNSNNTVQGLQFRASANYASSSAYTGSPISNTLRTVGSPAVYTITTGATAHNFRPGDLVVQGMTDANAYWGDSLIAIVPSTTTYTYTKTGVTGGLASQSTPGGTILAYEAILDDANGTRFTDITLDPYGPGYFVNFFDVWDDEAMVIDHFNGGGNTTLMSDAYSVGSFIYAACNQGTHNIAPVITLRDSGITASDATGITDYCSNGLYVENTILQATGAWQFNVSGYDGNYQGAYFKNIYSETSLASNPSSPARSPWPGLGIAGLIEGTTSQGGLGFQIEGAGSLSGNFPTGGSGTTAYSYYIVANDTTTGTQTWPMQILNWASTGSDSIPVKWPRVANGTDAITYDVIRMTSPVSAGQTAPYYGGCPGGSGGTCGYVAKGLSQATACSGTLVCTYTDTGSSSTSAYSVAQGTYSGIIEFWPGALVAISGGTSVENEQYPVVAVGTANNPFQVAPLCTHYGVSAPGAFTSCLASTNALGAQTATILTDGSGHSQQPPGMSGRLNFEVSPYSSGFPSVPGSINYGHIITLVDSNPALTQATGTYRRPASASDTWIGLDAQTALNAAQLAFGSPVSISNYIANTGSTGSGWLERLTTSLKEFNVPAKFDQSISISHLMISAATPTISHGFGTNASVVHNNGTAVFTVNVGTGGTVSSGVIGLPTAKNGWAVHCDDVTTQSTSVFITKQTASSTTSATITQYSDAAVPTAWTPNDVLVCQAAAY